MSGDRNPPTGDALSAGGSSVAGPFVIAADDPCLDGHFPGNPLVPAVVILDIAARALEQPPAVRSALAPGSKVAGVSQAKFFSPLRPGEPLSIEYRGNPDGSMGFRCHSGGRAVAEGAFVIRREERGA